MKQHWPNEHKREDVKSKMVENRAAKYVLVPPFPHNMLIELANICNHKCVFCGYRKMKRAKRVCDRELVERVLKEAFQNGTREVGFYVIGEPFLYQDLPEIISLAKKIGFEYIYLTTNGALASKEKLEQVILAGVDSIKFSINAATKETYRKIHGEDDFELVKHNVKTLADLKKENGLKIRCYISFIRTEWNKKEEAILFQEFQSLVDHIYVYDCVNQGGNMNELVTMGVIDEKNIRPGSSIPCDMIFNRIHVTAEGYLDACCADAEGYLAAVDLHQYSLKEAWESSLMQLLRKRHLENDLEGTACYNCIYNKEAANIPINKDLCKI